MIQNTRILKSNFLFYNHDMKWRWTMELLEFCPLLPLPVPDTFPNPSLWRRYTMQIVCAATCRLISRFWSIALNCVEKNLTRWQPSQLQILLLKYPQSQTPRSDIKLLNTIYLKHWLPLPFSLSHNWWRKFYEQAHTH